jgi:hypothetical protein
MKLLLFLSLLASFEARASVAHSRFHDCIDVVRNMGSSIEKILPQDAFPDRLAFDLAELLDAGTLDIFALWQTLGRHASFSDSIPSSTYYEWAHLVPSELASALRQHREPLSDNFRSQTGRSLAFLQHDLSDPEIDGVNQLHPFLSPTESLRLTGVGALPKAYPTFFHRFLDALDTQGRGASVIPMEAIGQALEEVLVGLRLDQSLAWDQRQFLEKTLASALSHASTLRNTTVPAALNLKYAFYVAMGDELRARLRYLVWSARLREPASDRLKFISSTSEQRLGIRYTGIVSELQSPMELATAFDLVGEGKQLVGLGKKALGRLTYFPFPDKLASVASYDPERGVFRLSAVVHLSAQGEVCIESALRALRLSRKSLRARLSRKNLPVELEFVLEEGKWNSLFWSQVPVNIEESPVFVRVIDESSLTFAELQTH